MRRSKGISQHIPQRTCVACRQVRPKRELIRLVHIANGGIEIDTSGKRAGRGAYLCKNLECWQAGLRGNRLDYTLRTTITKENQEQLMRWSKDVLEESIGGENR